MTKLNDASAVYYRVGMLGGGAASRVYAGPTLAWAPPVQERMLPNTPPTDLTRSGAYTCGTRFVVNANGRITHIRYWYGSGGTTRRLSVWNAAGVKLAGVVDNVPRLVSGDPRPEAAAVGENAWREIPLPAPVTVTAGLTYTVTYDTNGAIFGETQGTAVSLTPNLTIVTATVGIGNDTFPTYDYPVNYHADLIYVKS